MVYNTRNNTSGISLKRIILLLVLSCLSVANGWAQDTKTATISLSYLQTDSTKTLKATVLSDNKPVKGPEIHLYVKRMFGMLPVGKAVATDTLGEALINFPMDLPGDKDGIINMVVKIEKDEIYGSVEVEGSAKWGSKPKGELSEWGARSLSASREKAPMTLVVVSIGLIIGVWGTVLWLIFQLFRIKKAGKQIKKATEAAI